MSPPPRRIVVCQHRTLTPSRRGAGHTRASLAPLESRARTRSPPPTLTLCKDFKKKMSSRSACSGEREPRRIALRRVGYRPGKMGGSGVGREKFLPKKRQKEPYGVGHVSCAPHALHTHRTASDSAPPRGQNGWFRRRARKSFCKKKAKRATRGWPRVPCAPHGVGHRTALRRVSRRVGAAARACWK